jgi:hypothetical protein
MALSPTPLMFFAFSPSPAASAWTPAGDAARAARLKADAELRARSLQACHPSWHRVPLTRDDLETLSDDDGDDGSAPLDDVLARADRHIVLQGPWAGGTLTLRLHDALLSAELALADRHDDATPAELAVLLDHLAQASGWPLVGRPGEPPPTATVAADAAWQHQARLSDRLRRQQQGQRRLQAAGPAGALLLSAGAWALALLLLSHGIETGTLATTTDASRQAEFTVQRLAGARPGLNLPPRYRLSGIVDGGTRATELEVTRELYLRAAPGARYTVVPTGDLRRPLVLAHELQPPLLRGTGWGLSGSALAALLPLALWGWGVARPILRGRTPTMWQQMARRAIGVLAVAAPALAIWWLQSR